MTRAIHDALGWARDAVQARIIGQIFAQRVQGIVLKGGMAFRVAHPKWARATKDIDLDSDPEVSLGSLQKTVRQAIRRATMDGLLENVVITEPKQTETTARWKISGLYPRTGQTLHLTVEVSRRDKVHDEQIRHVYDGPEIDDLITVYTDRTLAFKKVQALLSETREAARDISDLFLLIQAHVDPPVAELQEWLATAPGPVWEQLWAKLDRMDFDTFRTQVLPSLPPTPDGQMLYRDWEEMRLKVGTHVEDWLRRAGKTVDRTGLAPSLGSACPPPVLHARAGGP